ncbi:MAG: penicillin-binding protein activator [Steroidobacteraceae bacterium]
MPAPASAARPVPHRSTAQKSCCERIEYGAAAREFEGLAADNAGTVSNSYLLRAADAWAEAGKPGEARRVLASVVGELAPAQRTDRQLLDARLALVEGDAARGWATVSALNEPTDPGQATRLFALRQQLAFATSRPLEGVRAEIARERVAADAEARFAARRELFAQLRDASARGVRLDPAAAGRDPLVRGWFEVGPIAAQATHGASAAPAIAAWRARYPDHPAGDLLRGEFSAPSTAAQLPPGAHVAVLLPLSGRNSAAGAQIRDGLLAAAFALPAAGRPTLRFYDTSVTSIADALSQAAAAGADFAIGPLTREDVGAAAELTGRRMPLLALNFLPVDRPAPPDFYQFALSPEDEARAAARRVLADGARHGVALVPAGDWGTRVLNAFQQELEAGGGQLLANAQLPPGRADYSGPIQSLLRLSDSRVRHKRLEGLLGTTLAFQPRRRGDIEFIFAPSSAAVARQVRPQLRFHYAGDIPAYATSDAFEPVQPTANQDLEGLLFPDMPWMLGTGATATRLRNESTEAWGELRGRGRLYAFGYDALQLYAALQRLQPGAAVDVDGATGRLRLDAERRVRRELSWAQMRSGTARALEALPGG